MVSPVNPDAIEEPRGSRPSLASFICETKHLISLTPAQVKQVMQYLGLVNGLVGHERCLVVFPCAKEQVKIWILTMILVVRENFTNSGHERTCVYVVLG